MGAAEGSNACSLPSALVARSNDLENLKRSIAMLSPKAMALSREEALSLLEELAEVQRRLERLRAGLRRLVEDE